MLVHVRAQVVGADEVAVALRAPGPVPRPVARLVQPERAPAGEAAAALGTREVVELGAGPAGELLAPSFGRQRELAGGEVHEIKVREPRHGGLCRGCSRSAGADSAVVPALGGSQSFGHGLLSLLVGAVDQEVVDHQLVLGGEHLPALVAPQEGRGVRHATLNRSGVSRTNNATSVCTAAIAGDALIPDGGGGGGGCGVGCGGGGSGSILMVLEEVVVEADKGFVAMLTFVLSSGALVVVMVVVVVFRGLVRVDVLLVAAALPLC